MKLLTPSGRDFSSKVKTLVRSAEQSIKTGAWSPREAEEQLKNSLKSIIDRCLLA